eukprot:359314-Chlamydomonas_euryale.AAC.2
MRGRTDNPGGQGKAIGNTGLPAEAPRFSNVAKRVGRKSTATVTVAVIVTIRGFAHFVGPQSALLRVSRCAALA